MITFHLYMMPGTLATRILQDATSPKNLLRFCLLRVTDWEQDLSRL
jgi:hypothetical protein